LTAPLFLSSRAEALARARAVDPQHYARTRNYLNGSVSRLSPYLTHGLIDTHTVMQLVAEKHRLDWNDKFAFELGWREYFSHVWSRLGDDIERQQCDPPASNYADSMPTDIVHATTGVPIIDQQIQQLYDTGYLHNHARMWISSYVVHVRKVSWRAGARWMYAHLLDGDLASNTLSWQWVAGTWTGKPYLFNAENVARYAPGVDCSGTVIDQSYEALAEIASGNRLPWASAALTNHSLDRTPVPEVLGVPMADERVRPAASASPSSASAFLMHPWSLDAPESCDVIGIINTDFHRLHPWSKMRWNFVIDAMHSSCAEIIVGSGLELKRALHGMSPRAVQTMNPLYRDLITELAPLAPPPPRSFANPSMLKRSFTSFWNHIKRETFPL
jgi:deoxyribodipyrimidine photo-lyase